MFFDPCCILLYRNVDYKRRKNQFVFFFIPKVRGEKQVRNGRENNEIRHFGPEDK